MARTLPFVANTTTCLTRDDPDIEPGSLTLSELRLAEARVGNRDVYIKHAALQKEAGVGAAGTVGSIARENDTTR